MTKLSSEGNDLLEAEPINKQRLDFIAASLNEKLNLVKTFDEEIIENGAVDEIEAEIQESDEINSRVMDLLRLINEATTPKDNNVVRMSGKLHLLLRMQTKLRPLVFNNQLQLLDQMELQLWLLKMFTFNYRGAQLMVEFNLLTPLQLLTLELCNHRIVLLQVTVLNHLLTLARMLILCPVNPRRNCPN